MTAICCVGISDLVVVETADAVLVADRHRVQEVKTLVARLQSLGRQEGIAHRRAYRPWGSYECVEQALCVNVVVTQTD